MNEAFFLNKQPQIAFNLQDEGFQLFDEQSVHHRGFFSYKEMQHIQLKRAWFPRLATYLRVFTWILNGVPYFPDTASCKKSSFCIQLNKHSIVVPLRSISMVKKAKKLQKMLESKL